jgi:hypothetical protein
MDATERDAPIEEGAPMMNPEGQWEVLQAQEYETGMNQVPGDAATPTLEPVPSPEAGLRLPDDESDVPPTPAQTVSRAEALERLRRGLPLCHVRIERLVFSGEFPKPVRLERVVLVRPFFEQACFLDEVTMTHCTLDRMRFGHPTTFTKGWNLKGSTLVHSCIRAVTVAGPLRCDNIQTRGRLLVDAAHFEAPVRFWEARFNGWVEFKDVHFDECADFRSLHANEGFVLVGCQFHKDFLFRGATVCKKWEADRSRFDGLLDLSKSKLHDFVYLENIEQGPEQRFAFQNALAERLLVRTDQLDGRLASERAGDHVQAMSEYGLLKRVFEGLHRYEQEDWAFSRFKVNQRRCRAHSWRRPWSELARFFDWLLLDHGCGYGTNPMRAVAAALVMMLSFAIIYMIGIERLHVDHAPFEGPATSLPNRLMIGLTTSVAAFTSGFGDLRDVARGGIMNVFLIVESLFGTLLWGLFIVAFSRKVIR